MDPVDSGNHPVPANDPTSDLSGEQIETPAPLPEPPAGPDTAAGPAASEEDGDASRGEVALYAFGNVEGAIADNFPNTLQNILIVAAHVNPLLLGLIMGIKTLWDSVTDPIMAYITDNAKTRWGRRRPFILGGGVTRVLFLALFIAFLPVGSFISENEVMEAQKHANDAVGLVSKSRDQVVLTHTQIWEADLAARLKMLEILSPMPLEMEEARAKVRAHLPRLREDAQERRQRVLRAEADLADAIARHGDGPEAAQDLAIPRGQLEAALDKLSKAEDLISKAVEAERKALATAEAARYLLAVHAPETAGPPYTEEEAQARLDASLETEGLAALGLFEAEKRPAPKPRARKGAFDNIKDGFFAFSDPRNADQRWLIIYVMAGVLIFTTLTTVNSVPYYALGIELSPSYNGRTQVVTYRAIMNKIAGLLAPWVPVFCFSLLFVQAIDGLFWVAVFSCIIGIPSTVLMCWYTRERTQVKVKKAGERPSLLKAMWEISKNRDFLRILFLYVFIGLTNGLFQQIGFFLNVYWVMGSALSGAALGAWVSMVAWGLGFISLPIINWGCRRFQKHRVLGFAIIWMSIGTILKWWAMDPAHPEYQFILPFFFSIGIGTIYTVLPTMMADVTDVDELRHGLRREGMFGAVMAFLMKTISAVVPILAGAVLVVSGFDPSLEYHQEASTIFNMRVLYSFVPGVLLLFALVAVWRYPLTRDKVSEIKAELKRRHAQSRISS